jgi:hypothetical protein
MRSALDMFAQEGVLSRVEMIECAHCQMAAFRSDYQEGLDEYDEYQCTGCQQLLTDRTIRFITAYRRGEKWNEIRNPSDASGNARLRNASLSSVPSNVMLDEKAFYTHDRLAEIFSLDKESLRKRLDRHRKNTVNGWKVNDDRRPREAKYLYELRTIKAIIDELRRASSQRPAK